MEDIFHLLDIIKEMGNKNIREITKENIGEVFYKSNIKRIQELGLVKLDIYKSDQKSKFEKPKELTYYMFTDLIVRSYIEQKISLYYSLPNA